MTPAIEALTRPYNPALLVVLGVGLLAAGLLTLIFPRFVTRLRARQWRGTVRATAFDGLLARVASVCLLVAGAICLLVVLVRAAA